MDLSLKFYKFCIIQCFTNIQALHNFKNDIVKITDLVTFKPKATKELHYKLWRSEKSLLAKWLFGEQEEAKKPLCNKISLFIYFL